MFDINMVMCQYCNGRGFNICPECEGLDCQHCGGEGIQDCEHCQGTGEWN